MTYTPATFEVATSRGFGHDLQENTLFDLRDQGHTLTIRCTPLHHVTYAPAKFEVAMSNGLRMDRLALSQTDRRLDYGMTLIYPFSIEKNWFCLFAWILYAPSIIFQL